MIKFSSLLFITNHVEIIETHLDNQIQIVHSLKLHYTDFHPELECGFSRAIIIKLIQQYLLHTIFCIGVISVNGGVSLQPDVANSVFFFFSPLFLYSYLTHPS